MPKSRIYRAKVSIRAVLKWFQKKLHILLRVTLVEVTLFEALLHYFTNPKCFSKFEKSY